MAFKPGDKVVKVFGKKPAVVEHQYGYRYTCRYCHSGVAFYARESDLKLYEEEDEMTTTKTLYSFTKEDGTVAYGTHIGTNSLNQYIIEEKGTGTIHTMDKSSLEEVLPYTFSASINGKETHYVGVPDSVKKGDLLLYTGSSTPQIALVTAVDTKNKSARNKFKGARLVTEPI